jgi:hypothetical protein
MKTLWGGRHIPSAAALPTTPKENLRNCFESITTTFHLNLILKMLSSSIRMNVARVAVRTQKSVPVRTFFGKKIFENFKRTIPTDEEQQTGRRKLEVDANARGEEAFSLEPVIPPVNAGTKENPILVILIYFDFFYFF